MDWLLAGGNSFDFFLNLFIYLFSERGRLNFKWIIVLFCCLTLFSTLFFFFFDLFVLEVDS